MNIEVEELEEGDNSNLNCEPLCEEINKEESKIAEEEEDIKT